MDAKKGKVHNKRTENPLDVLYKSMAFEPTVDQQDLSERIVDFLVNGGRQSLFVMRGYAGTGKTTMLSALVKFFEHYGVPVILMAPTGRAAKVMSNYTGQSASTIHKRIYIKKQAGDGRTFFGLNKNMLKKAFFIIDEASMIAAGDKFSKDAFGSRNILDDLIEYVYSGQDCRAFFVGDTAQLPPVGEEFSAALNDEYIERHYPVKVYSHTLRDVVRQEEGSGILNNATELRELIAAGESGLPQIDIKGYDDVVRVNGRDLTEELDMAYSKYGQDNVLVICRSNKSANLYNQQIRARVLYCEDALTVGDRLMIVKNNYFWTDPSQAGGFLANGDMMEVQKIVGQREMYGFEFADIWGRMVDRQNEPEVELRVLMDSILSESAQLPRADMKTLFKEVEKDYMDISFRKKRMKKVMEDPYFNAVQIKFAYAVTCHKAQGGQWKAIFIDQGFLTDEMLDISLLRWLYTAFTRATEKVYLVNFHPRFFGEDQLDSDW